MIEPDAREPEEPGARNPSRHFWRKVYLALVLPGMVLAAVCWWRGWTSAEEVTYGLLVTGALLFLAGVLPSVGAQQAGWNLSIPGYGWSRWNRHEELAPGLSPGEAFARDEGYIVVMLTAAALYVAAGFAVAVLFA
ncbi:MAG: hypothetical protein Kow0010_17900 [Dehalococcoidia bacterium]